VFPLRINGNQRISFYSLFHPIHSCFAKASRLLPPNKRTVEEEKEEKEHSLPRYGAPAGNEVRNAFLRRRPSHAAPLVRAKPPLPLMPSAGTSSSGKARIDRRMRNENSICATQAQDQSENERERRHTDTPCLMRCVERGNQPQSDFVLDLESQPVRSSKRAPAILKI
jgi:hypothetical protein